MNIPRTIDDVVAHPICTLSRDLYAGLAVEYARQQSPVVASAMEHVSAVGGKFANFCGSGDWRQLDIARGAAFSLVTTTGILGLFELDAKRVLAELDGFITYSSR